MKARLWQSSLIVWGVILGYAGRSAALEPERYSAWSPVGWSERSLSPDSHHLELSLKRYARPGATPVLLVHGLAQNDRIWDSPREEFNVARFLYRQGFDVWIGNYRGAGTEGFRSQQPEGPHHWTVDDYAAFDLPALVQRVREISGQRVFLVGHSLTAWAIEGYLAGLTPNAAGQLAPDPERSKNHSEYLRGVVTIAGVYNLWWRKPVARALKNPIRTEADFYGSNYELELLSQVNALYHVIPRLRALPLNWIDDVLNLPVERIPVIGRRLKTLYRDFQSELARSPVFSMFYFTPNTAIEMVEDHVQDGMEDLGPRLIEQLSNAIRHGRTTTYFHLKPSASTYAYGAIREQEVHLPYLFIGGGRDRLAGIDQIYRDGYLATRARTKHFIGIEEAGHLDILTGHNSREQVLQPLVRWMRQHGG